MSHTLSCNTQLDFQNVDTESRGQSRMYACSGGFKDASLRILGQGVGVSPLGSGQGVCTGLLGMWGLASTGLIVMAYYNDTRVLSAADGVCLSEQEHAIVRNETTLWCSDTDSGCVVQVC